MRSPVMLISDLVVAGRSGGRLSDINLELAGGTALGLLGDSGSGKSLLCAAITGTLIPPARVVHGAISVNGEDILNLQGKAAQRFRGSGVSYIGPNPHSLLHPMITIGKQISNVLRSHENVGRREAEARVLDMLRLVGIPDPKRRFDAYSHELSGGMAQRVVIAMGLICDPMVIVADEPTFGLDVTIQAQVLQQMQDLIRADMGKTIIISTRDLGVVANFCESVAVIADGTIAEIHGAREFFTGPSSIAGERLLMAAQGRDADEENAE